MGDARSAELSEGRLWRRPDLVGLIKSRLGPEALRGGRP
jgi:hypothetical protein